MPADPAAKPNLKLSAEQLAEAGIATPGANGHAPKPPKIRPENG
jgi:hypothetical protein